MSRRTRPLSFESLEKRQLLTKNILIENGFLGFPGTKGDDVMKVEHIGNQYKLTLNGQSTFINDAGLQGVIVDGFGGNDDITIDQSVTVLTGVLGAKGDDTIRGGGGENYLFGDAGNDTIFSGGPSSSNIISGGAGDDIIHCGTGDTQAHGEQGNDTIYGEDSYCTLFGEAGDDQLYASSKGERGTTSIGCTMYGGPGNDTLIGTGNDRQDHLYGGPGNDVLRGNHDVMYGEAGNDTIYGGDGDDPCYGGKGNDIIYGGGGDDELYGNEGRDQLFGELGNDRIHGGAGNDILHGGQGFDLLYGEQGNDLIYGDDGHDEIDGGLGNDICHGGEGDDWITGGVGRNQLDGDSGSNILNTTNTTDTLLNGIQGDTRRNVFTSFDGPDYLLGSGYGAPYYTSPYGSAGQNVLNKDGVLTYTLTVYLYGLQPNATCDIFIDGILIDQVTADRWGNVFPLGEAGLFYSTNPTGNERPLPPGFAGAQPGSTIQIDNLAFGTFQQLAFGGYF